jgi:general stress protein 26
MKPTTPTTPTKKEFINRFHLTKTNTKAIFQDGLSPKTRSLYINHRGELYIFYNHDLHIVRTFKCNPYTEGMEKLTCSLGSGYSWYHYEMTEEEKEIEAVWNNYDEGCKKWSKLFEQMKK